MRLLYLITRAERGGSQVHLADLLRGLCGEHDLHLVVGEEGYLCEEARKLGIPVHIVHSLVQPLRPLQDILAVFKCVTLFRTIKPDLIHAHTSKAGMVGRLAGTWARTPVVYTAHTWAFAEGMSRLRRLIAIPIERYCATLTARIITVSEANRQLALAASIGIESHITTIWNGVPDKASIAAPSKGSPARIVMVARFAPQKDQRLLLQALAQTKLPFELLLIGAGETLHEMKALTISLGLTRHVVFLGDRDDVAEILSNSHIFVLSSKWEGFPLSILEAMRAGLPVIASRVGGVSEAVRDGVNGLLVSPGDEAELRLALETLINDAHLRDTMGRFGRAMYLADFCSDVMLSKTNAVYFETMRSAVSITPQEL